jgi:hypothetical protein
MITARTIAAIQSAFEQAVRENTRGNTEALAITSAPPTCPSEQNGRQLFVLTIAALEFRIVTLFDFRLDAASGNWFANLLGQEGRPLAGHALLDAMAEYVNMVCGAANRLISDDRRRTGMSTPFPLEPASRAQIQCIGTEQTLTLQVHSPQGMRYELLLCLCSTTTSHVEFELTRLTSTESVGGELELF